MNPQPVGADLPELKPISEIVKPVQKATPAEATVPDTKSPNPSFFQEAVLAKGGSSFDFLIVNILCFNASAMHLSLRIT